MASNHPLALLLRKFETHATLGKEDRKAILALPYTLRTLEAQSYTTREAEPPSICAVLVSGYAIRHKLTGDGARQIVSVHIPGEPLDLQNLYLDTADHNVQTLTRSELAIIPRAAMQDLARSRTAIANAITMVMMVEASIFREWVLNVGRRNSRSRLAHLLCEISARLKAQGLWDGGSYELPMTQEQLSDALGLTSIHVNRTLKTLEGEGLISRDRRRVSFSNHEKLRKVGDFNELYLHLRPQSSG